MPTAPPVAGAVHVWSIPLDGGQTLSAHEAVLSAAELERAGRFVTGDLRRRFIVARGTLRQILAQYTGASPDALEFAAGQHGKPSLVGAGGLEFNLSHSGELAVVALTSGLAVGIDVEQLREVPDADAIAERFFSVTEQQQFRRLAASDRLNGFFRCWTRKEAFIKATGEGLSRPLGSFDVTLAQFDPRLTRIDGRDGGSAGWTLRSFQPAAGYEAAIAVRHTDVTLLLRTVQA